ncbi:MAG TPA: DUF2905 domain-containing protein [Pirellulales bacterium]|nr:DUF2905 domain-containing protein [Pirellulales bacterium]
MNHPGWGLVIIGLAIAVIGIFWLVMPHIPLLGRLPGDVAIERDNFRLYVPLTTCLVLSVLLSGVLYLVRYLSR